MYPVENVLYQEARHFTLERVKAQGSVLVFDTSALAYPQLGPAILRSYLDSGGTIILEQHVVNEINHQIERDGKTNNTRPGGSDTRDLPRIATNGTCLISLIENKITDVTTFPEFDEEKMILGTISTILPKVQTYTRLHAQFPALYDSLASLSQFHARNGNVLTLADLRGRGKDAYDRLHEVVSEDSRMSPVERANLEFITDTQHTLLHAYCTTAAEKLGEYARASLTLFGARKNTIEHLKTETRHVMDSILLRMLGYLHDPTFNDRKDAAIAQCYQRFRVDLRSQDTDSAVTMASYIPDYPRDKAVYLLSSDTDLRFSLRIRQVIAQHHGSPSRRLRAIS